MLKVRVVCVGKLKERYWEAACEEYCKRISRYATPEIVQLPEHNPYRNPGPAEIQDILEKESVRMLQVLREEKNVVLLCVEGRKMDSPAFSDLLQRAPQQGDTITFVIGGSYGIAPCVKQQYRQHVSFSDMTFPHQLMRVVLLEQIYRGFQIIGHGNYHK